MCIHFEDIVISDTYFYPEKKAIFQNIKYKSETQ